MMERGKGSLVWYFTPIEIAFGWSWIVLHSGCGVSRGGGREVGDLINVREVKMPPLDHCQNRNTS